MPREGPGSATGMFRGVPGAWLEDEECHVAVAHGADMVAVGKGQTLIILPGISGSLEQRYSSVQLPLYSSLWLSVAA